MKSKILFFYILLCFSNLFTQNLNDITNLVDTFSLIDSVKAQKLNTSLISTTHSQVLELCIEVIDLVSLDTLQKSCKDYHAPCELEYAFTFKDVNFDDIEDLMVLNNVGNSGNESYDIWIYDPNNKKYFYNDELTKLLGCNPIIDPFSKEYYTSASLGCMKMCWINETYKYINGKIIKIEEEQQSRTDSLDIETGQYIFYRYLKKLKNDSLVVVKEVYSTLSKINNEWEK